MAPHLVHTRRVRPWLPLFAVPTLCILTIGLFAGDEVGWQGRISIAAGLGIVLGLAFDAWWFASAAVKRLRHRVPRPQGEGVLYLWTRGHLVAVAEGGVKKL